MLNCVFLTINGESINLDQESNKLPQLSIADIHFKYQDGVFSWYADLSMRKLIGNDFDTYEKIVLADNGKRFIESFFNDKKGRASNYRRDIDKRLNKMLRMVEELQKKIQQVYEVTDNTVTLYKKTVDKMSKYAKEFL